MACGINELLAGWNSAYHTRTPIPASTLTVTGPAIWVFRELESL